MTEQPVEPDTEILTPPNEDIVIGKLRKGRRQAIAALVLMFAGVAVSCTVSFAKPVWLDEGWSYSLMLWSALFWWWAYDNMKTAHNLVVHDYNDMVDEFNALEEEYGKLYESADAMADIAEKLLDQHGERVPEEDVDETWQALKAQLEGDKP